MASVKVKFRPSTQEGKEGTIYYQIIHKRVIRQIKNPFLPQAQDRAAAFHQMGKVYAGDY